MGILPEILCRRLEVLLCVELIYQNLDVQFHCSGTYRFTWNQDFWKHYGILSLEIPKSVHELLLHFAVSCRVAGKGNLVRYFHFIYHIPAEIVTPTRKCSAPFRVTIKSVCCLVWGVTLASIPTRTSFLGMGEFGSSCPLFLASAWCLCCEIDSGFGPTKRALPYSIHDRVM
jgi:hypothetical protein